MAAYAALVSLMNIIHDIQRHHSPPISVDIQQAQSLSHSIASLQLFLETHNTSPVFEIDEADPLEMRIADAAYAAEDIIESHIVNRILPENIPFSEDATHNDDPRRLNRIIKLFSCFRALKKPENNDDATNLYEDLQRVIEDMESIEKMTVQINADKAVVHNQRPRSLDATTAPSKSFSTRQKSITVFSDDVINEVMEKLSSGRLDCHVIPIVGMGGIGKTTLAKYIYGQPFIKEHFDICAWTTISQQYNAKEIFCEILCQVTNKERKVLSEMSEDELEMKLHQCLFCRRYLIVMDDMWTVDAWNRIRRFFPNNENGSRVLVTTRLSHLSSKLNENYSHHMKFLNECSSWDLFSKIVFGEESCPSELEGIGKNIVENCRGLPLSIVVVGGILKKLEYTQRSWESIAKNLTSTVNLENNKHCLRLLSLSYSHLPVYLKPCFLYMGVFEEDSEIKVSTLIKLWVGEGLLKPKNDESLEAIGKRFLKDLVDRNLILVHRLGSTGNVKYCKIHDLLRDFCLSEGKKDEFYHVIGQDSPRGLDRIRRLVMPYNTAEKKVIEDFRSMSVKSHVRSVISEFMRPPLCKNFRMVRVIHEFKGYGIMDLDALKFVNLRHLVVKVDSMFSFFSSVTLHWNLHTLIVDCNYHSTAPLEIWKMPQFRHIEFVGEMLFLPDPPRDAVVMENLQTLMGVENFKLGEETIEGIPNMKKLKLWYSWREGFEHEDYCCLSNIRHLCNLEYLLLSWVDFKRVESLNKLTFPHSLKKLLLSIIPKFEWQDILEKVGSLPFLEKLQLRNGGGFRRGEWEIAEGQFPCLKYLRLFLCSGLRKITTQDYIIFPRLECLYLDGLTELEEIPYEIGEIVTLQKILMKKCNTSVVKRAKEIVEEQMESQGDDLSFKVEVSLHSKDEQLLSLAGPNFQVFA